MFKANGKLPPKGKNETCDGDNNQEQKDGQNKKKRVRPTYATQSPSEQTNAAAPTDSEIFDNDVDLSAEVIRHTKGTEEVKIEQEQDIAHKKVDLP